MKVLPPTHPAAVPVDIGQSSRPHDDVVDGVALSLQGTENKDAHGGIELQLRPRLDGLRRRNVLRGPLVETEIRAQLSPSVPEIRKTVTDCCLNNIGGR